MASINPHLQDAQGSSFLPSGAKSDSINQNSAGVGFNPSISSIPQIPSFNLPKGGGAIRGIGETLEVNAATGTASVSIPIQTSPARNGSQPNLLLKYNSGSGNGPYGLGWQLEGVSTITRKTSKGLPQYDDNGGDQDSDVFILDGADDLVPVFKRASQSAIVQTKDGNPVIDESVQNGYIVRLYMPRIEKTFIRIERWTNTLNPADIYWRTISPTNVVNLYGPGASSRIFDPNSATGTTERIMTWLLSETYDSAGNATVCDYVAENSVNVSTDSANEQNRSNITRSANRYIKSIKYGNKVPNRSLPDWAAVSAHTLAEDAWMFQIIFDYGEHDAINPKPSDSGNWVCRQDPFSTHKSGFEIRTYRLCQRILMFHMFQELDSTPTIVSSTNLAYADNPMATYLTSITHTGFVLDATKIPTIQKSLPPVTFSYSAFPSDDQLMQLPAKDIAQESMQNLPNGLDDSTYQFVDLNGEGLPGFLSEDTSAWFYKDNLSANNEPSSDSGKSSGPVTPKLGPVQTLSTRPSASMHELAHFGDVTGSGNLDLISNEAGCWGYYEKQETGGWGSFNQFRSFPAISPDDVGFKLVDLTGDGLVDILLCGDATFYWYPSLGALGYGPGTAVTQLNDENNGPACLFSDTEATMYLADMTGDGLSDLVRIKQTGGVCYWPNLGYGRFGSKVEMDNPPLFDSLDTFNQTRIQLADVDGSGTTDIIYMGRNGAFLFANQSGNSFSSGKQLGSFLEIDQFTKLSTVDLLGNGTTCIVWSSSLPSAAAAPMKYVDPMAGQKPHLLLSMNNNLGAETRLSYSPSTRFFLEDKENGIRWVTRLPFPVQCVAKQVIFDHVSGNRFTKRFHYSHGFFDGIEREFRGFAKVITWDADEFSTNEAVTGSNLDPTWQVPPVVVKTWYHTGAYFGDQPLEDFLASEFYSPSSSVASFRSLRCSTVLSPELLKAGELQEAYRTMKGHMLRREIYSDDKSTLSAIPYSIEENSLTIRAIQGLQDAHLHSIFQSYPRETVKYAIDRDPTDPRISHNMTLEVDKWGHQTKGLSIAYGRLPGKSTIAAPDRAKQETTVFSYFETDYTNDISTADDYRLRVLFETRQYELTGFAKPASAWTFPMDNFTRDNFGAISSLTPIPFEQSVTPSSMRLVARSRVVFRSDDLSGFLGPGVLQPLALPGRTYQECFTPGLLAVFQRNSPNQSTENLLTDPKTSLGGLGESQGGYVDLNGDGNWWIPSSMLFYHPDPRTNAAAELAEGRAHFFVPRRFTDAFGNSSLLTYDDYSLLIVATEDALKNKTAAVIDYRALGPTTLIDQNGNRSVVALDALGLVTGTATMGKPGQNLGDNLNAFNAYASQSDCDAFFSDPRGPTALSLLGNATSRVLYDINRYFRNPSKAQPAYAAVITRETHVSDLAAGQNTRIRVVIAYSDGFSRVIQKKAGADAGPLSEGGPFVSDRWITTGWTIFNNKGAVVRTFEPFFDQGNDFKAKNIAGVSSVTMYDPIGRAAALLEPNHSLQKVIFSSWSTVTFDFNDNVLLSDPRNDEKIGQYFEKLPHAEFLPSWYDGRINGQRGSDEQIAAQKAALHSNTPSTVHFDVLGRTILAISDNGSNELIQTQHTYDIQGNVLQTHDDKGRLVCQADFNMCKSNIHIASMDAAERWSLLDSGGHSILAWNSRGGYYRTSYDALRRQVGFYWSENGTQEFLVQLNKYGESEPAGVADNLRGKLVEIRDQAGIVAMPKYDWKGNNLQTTRQFAMEYKTTLDWTSNIPLLPDAPSPTSGTYDAYNRPVFVTSADGSTVLRLYDERGYLKQVNVNLKGQLATLPVSWPAYIKAVSYDAKGQLIRIDYGNGTSSVRSYDPETFRLKRLLTTRPSTSSGVDALQDLTYTHDPVGNVSYIRDKAIQTVYFANTVVDPSNNYTYDAVYRLIRAAGREHLASNPAGPSASAVVPLASPANGNAMATYVEDYRYDSVGNILQIKHAGSAPEKPGWTKTFSFGETSQIPGQSSVNNRLSSTSSAGATENYRYEGSAGRLGGLTSIPQTSIMTWDFLEQLSSSSRQVVTTGTIPETTYYVYDFSGTRVRKITERQASAGQNPTMLKETRYLGQAEVFRKYAGDGTTATLERESLSVQGVSGRVALIESRTAGTSQGPALLIRYQLDNLIGSAVLELDDQAQILTYEEYFPFGSTSCQSVSSRVEAPKRYRFTGKERDEESGLYYHGARYYAPWIGRWISCDPAGFVDGLNLYIYARNQPTILVDPSGHKPTKEQPPKPSTSKPKNASHGAPAAPKPESKPAAAEPAKPNTTVSPPPGPENVSRESIQRFQRQRETDHYYANMGRKPDHYDYVDERYNYNKQNNPLFSEYEKEMEGIRDRPGAPVNDYKFGQNILTAEHDEMVNRGINIALKYARAQLDVEQGPGNYTKGDLLMAANYSYIQPLRDRADVTQDKVVRDVDRYVQGRLHDSTEFALVYDILKSCDMVRGQTDKSPSPPGGRHWLEEGKRDFEAAGGSQGLLMKGDVGAVSHQPYINELEEVRLGEVPPGIPWY